ncbi:hypothetical protein SO802_022222 [Lithocarpus litseifolius]|uniref:RNase H type-1 domain-containing protein n=1 Tax=Lithocarpus litseifolius TaxID=425828 RepID=A0AAW2CHA8_9ROSI
MVNNASLFLVPWHTLFSFGIWTIWNHRNKVVFQSRAPSPSIHQEVIQRALEYFFCAQGNSLYKLRVLKMVRWERPYRGWYKLNTDGSAAGSPEVAGGGGVLRDDAGLWVKGFARQIGHTTSFLAELWALRDGLTMCLDLRINALEMDILIEYGHCSSWSSDGSKVTAGSSDWMVYIWDTTSRRILYKIPGHIGSINECLFHPSEHIVGLVVVINRFIWGRYEN